MTQPSTETGHQSDEIGQSVSLPVIESTQPGSGKGPRTGAPMMGRTKTARWRAAVLILVNVLMIAHLIQWLIAGMTISPIEPSEAMETLEVGVINAGAILFLLAFLSVAFFGRFFCGWLCHIVALQDLCAWMMTKAGIRPKPFRSRLLVYFPFFLGMYMFVWPSFKRLVLAPILKSAHIDWPAWLRPVNQVHQWSSGLIVDDFWATMPPWFIAVPFLLLCGFGAVYFLGAKGFCTYGCPYAAFFKPLDKIAPVRVRVNDDCHQCGYCTSVCTSNVRVSEEVRDFGMVVDAGCMKTLDCISACPNDALSLGLGKVALGAKPRSPETYKQAKAKRARRYDLSLKSEIIASVVFLWFFFATRGMLDAVPMLMAGGLAAIGVMIVMTSAKLFFEQNARLYNHVLKSKGKIKPAGIVMMLMAVVFIGGSVWSGQARLMRWRGDVLYASTQLPTSMLLRPEFNPSPSQRAHAESAIWSYQRADSPKTGGLGWSLNAEHRLRLSYFLTVLGRYDEALDQLMVVINEGNPTDTLVIQAGQLSTMAINMNPPADLSPNDLETYRRKRLLSIYKDALEAHPNLHAIRTELARNAYSMQEKEKADALWVINDFDDDPMFFLAQAGYTSFAGEMEKTRVLYDRALALTTEADDPQALLINVARAAMQNRMINLALELAQRAVDFEDATTLTWLAAGEIANMVGQSDLGKERALHALTMPGVDRPMVQIRAANVLALPGDTDQTRELLKDAAERAHDPFEVAYIARGMVFAGRSLGDQLMLDQGLELFKGVTRSYPDLYVLGYDYALLLYQLSRQQEAADELVRVAGLDSTNTLFATRAGDILRAVGDEEGATKWSEEAQKRALLEQE
jgi:polyferredoxin/tetratricopeptide (TPR) repeat protein